MTCTSMNSILYCQIPLHVRSLVSILRSVKCDKASLCQGRQNLPDTVTKADQPAFLVTRPAGNVDGVAIFKEHTRLAARELDGLLSSLIGLQQ